MRKFVSILLILSAAACFGTGYIQVRFTTPMSPFPPPRQGTEQYGTAINVAGNTTLNWQVMMHTDQPRPMGLVLHIGAFRAGQAGPLGVCRDLYDAGYNCAAIQYRLADPGMEMRPPIGDQPVADHGLYPEALEDVSQAIIAAKTGSTTNTSGLVTGKVFLVGGEAGASHASYFAGANIYGGDQVDAAVLLSGAYNFADPASNINRCGTNNTQGFANYVGCDPTTPACVAPGGPLDLASSFRVFSATSKPVYIASTNHDIISVTQYNSMVSLLTTLGVTFQSNLITEATQPNGCTRSSYQYWHPVLPTYPVGVQTAAIAFLELYVPSP